jgi:hypothetical protein
MSHVFQMRSASDIYEKKNQRNLKIALKNNASRKSQMSYISI